MEVKVYTLSACVQCDSTKRFLDKHLIEYEEVSLNRSPKARERVQQLGYTQAPVIEAGDQHWSGFRLERLQGIVNAIHGQESKA
jgi:glutaredoxin-like protein NrdH